MNLGSVGPIRRYSVWKLQPCSNPGEGLGYGLQFSVTLTNERNGGNCRPFEPWVSVPSNPNHKEPRLCTSY